MDEPQKSGDDQRPARYGVYGDELAPFDGKCDVLLAPTGADLVLPVDALDCMIDILKPKWFVPMHYNLPPLVVVEPSDMKPEKDFNPFNLILVTSSSNLNNHVNS